MPASRSSDFPQDTIVLLCSVYLPHPTLGVFSALPSLKPISPFPGSESHLRYFQVAYLCMLIFISENIIKLCLSQPRITCDIHLKAYVLSDYIKVYLCML